MASTSSSRWKTSCDEVSSSSRAHPGNLPAASGRRADQTQTFPLRIILDETGAVEEKGRAFGGVIGWPVRKAGMVRIPIPGEVDPGLTDFGGKRQGRRPPARLADAAIGVIENECDLTGMESAGPSLQHRRPPTENVLVRGRAAERRFALSLRDVNLAPRRGRDCRPKLERSRIRICPAIRFNDVSPVGAPLLAGTVPKLFSGERVHF